MEMTYNDGLKPRSRRDCLFVGHGETVAEFTGESIHGVVAVVGSNYEKNGKWSNTTYQLIFAKDAWYMISEQSWEERERFHGCRSVADVVELFRAAGCAAKEQEIVKCLDTCMSVTMKRIRETEAAIASVGG